MDQAGKGGEMMQRRHWQCSEGMAYFSENLNRMLPAAIEAISDNELTGILAAPGPEKTDKKEISLYRGFELGKLLTAKCMEEFQPYSKSSLLDQHISQHTYFGPLRKGGPAVVMQEGLETLTYFPLNVLWHLQNTRGPSLRNRGYSATSLAGIASLLRARWFVEECLAAAKAPREFWADYSSRRFQSPNEMLLSTEEEGMPSLFETDRNIRLGKQVTELMRFYANKANDSRGVLPRSDTSTSGCPVRHRKPAFRPTDLDKRSIHELAELFDMSEEEIKRTREQSGIELGLSVFADLLDRAHNLQIVQEAVKGPAETL